MQQQHLASARNRRLAQQMENRPSVQAALNQKQVRPKMGQVHVVCWQSCWARFSPVAHFCNAALASRWIQSQPLNRSSVPSEPEAAPGQRQHPGTAGPTHWSHDAWGGWWRQRTARDGQRWPSRASQRRSDEGSAVPERFVFLGWGSSLMTTSMQV